MRRLLPTLIACTLLAAAPASASAAWVWPVSGEVITPYRNGTDPYASGQHRGIDIAAPAGTPVVAAAGGDVRFAGTAGSSGLTISVRTSDGYDTSYLHLSSLAVRAGAHVSTGERLGAVGTTGVRSAEAPHLHFGVRDAGIRHDYHDPLAFLPAPPPAATPQPPPPASAPAPVAPPAAAPAPTPGAAPRSAPRAAPVGAPHGRPAPQPVRRPRPAPLDQLAGAPAPRLAPAQTAPLGHSSAPIGRLHSALSAHTGSPSSTDTPAPQERSRHRGSYAVGPAPDARAHVSPAAAWPASPPVAREISERRESSRPDLAWIAACGGLILAAAVLGIKRDGPEPRSRSQAKLVAALRPLFGGR